MFGGGTFGGFWNTGNEAPGVQIFDQSANNSNKTGVKATYTHSDLPIAGLTVTGGLDWLRDETLSATSASRCRMRPSAITASLPGADAR